MKFVSANAGAYPIQNNENDEQEEANSSEADISSDSDSDQNEDEIVVNNTNNMLWTDEIVTIDTRQVSRSYNNTPAIHISDIANATPRLFLCPLILLCQQ